MRKLTLIDKKFLSNARISYVTQLLNICLGFISVTLVVKFAGLGIYGMMTVILALGATITNLVSFRTNEALVRFYRRGKANNNHELQYFAVAAGLILDAATGFALLAIIQVFAHEIGLYFLKNPAEQDAIVLFSYMASANFLRGTGYGLLTAQERFNTINALAVLEQIVKVACIGWGVWSFDKLQLRTIILLMLASSIPFTLFYLFSATKQLLHRPLFRWRRSKWIKIYWQFSLSTFISATLKSGHKNLDAVILGYFSTPATVGIYNLLKQFISPLDMLATPYATQIYPKFVDVLSKKSIQPVRLAIQQGTRALLLKGSVIMLPISPLVYVYFAWNGIEINQNEYLAFFIMLLASFMIQSLWWSRAFSLTTQPQLSIKANAIAMIITIGAMPLLVVKLGGLVGAASAVFIGAAVLHLFWNREIKKAYVNLYKNAKSHIPLD